MTPNDYSRIVDIVKREFNFGAIYLDMARLQPQAGKSINIEQDVYEFKLMKQLKDQMSFYFHSLIWFRNAPVWMRNLQKAELANAIQDHATTIAAIIDKNSLPNKPPVISVVNEAYDNGDFFKDKIGEEYVDIAFQAARKAAPSAVLIYNDYANHVFPPRWDGTRYKLTKKTVDRLKSKGLIDGVGLQMHLDGSSPPSKQELIATMRSCGVPVYITEFDVNMRNVSGTAEERNRIQTEIYRDVTEAAIESGVCRGIIDFQLGDKFSFFENVTTSGGYSENADPTPFDDDLNPKPAFFAQRKAFLTASSGN